MLIFIKLIMELGLWSYSLLFFATIYMTQLDVEEHYCDFCRLIVRNNTEKKLTSRSINFPDFLSRVYVHRKSQNN